MTCDEQLALWIEGNSVHNDERQQCCPDFSCCEPELLAPLKERIAFTKANEDARMSMLGVFLARMMSKHSADVNVYVAGEGNETKH